LVSDQALAIAGEVLLLCFGIVIMEEIHFMAVVLEIPILITDQEVTIMEAG
jgi:hypothetical protein